MVEEIGRGSASDGGFQTGLNLNSSNAVEILEQLKASGAKIAGGSGSQRRRKA